MRISDWSSDVCSSDLPDQLRHAIRAAGVALWSWNVDTDAFAMDELGFELWDLPSSNQVTLGELSARIHPADRDRVQSAFSATRAILGPYETDRSEEHTSELQSLMRISYAVFCLQIKQ